MDVGGLLARLRAERISPLAYAVNEVRDDACCLFETSSGDWLVFYSQRGHRYEQRAFVTESAACEHLLHMVLSDETTRADYRSPFPPPC